MEKKEPKIKISKCAYCGDAPVNHRLTYIDNLLASIINSNLFGSTRNAPKVFRTFANYVPVLLFRTLIFFRLAHLSDDIEKASSFRSRIIWEEANRRGIKMQQVILGKRPIDWYRASMNGKNIYFESIPIQPEYLDLKKDWDNKVVLKKELKKNSIPVPEFFRIGMFNSKSLEYIFHKFEKPVIVKPAVGSRARHTSTNINSIEDFKKAVALAKQLNPSVVVESHLSGNVCRATVVGGKLAGFYRAENVAVIGDGKSTIMELINKKDEERPDRVEKVHITDELISHIKRSGFELGSILGKGEELELSHRFGRLFGGQTREMVESVHPSFIEFFEKAANVVDLSVVGFDCIVEDPEKPADSQRWGIIECNTLPFIDLHYYALVGKPKNIAGMVWDLWG